MTIMTRSSKWLNIPTVFLLIFLQSACSDDNEASKAIADDSPAAQENAGTPMPEFKDPRPSDPVLREFDKLVELAKQGDSNADARIAWMYHTGEGVEKNEQLAFEWMKKAAEKGDSTSQDNLGVFYRDGTGTAADSAEAVKWFKKSALQGNPQGQGNLGQAYIDGNGVEKNNYLGYVWSGLSAKSGKAEFAKSNQNLVGSLLKPDERAVADKSIAQWSIGKEPDTP
jgi:TPR repeat protein